MEVNKPLVLQVPAWPRERQTFIQRQLQVLYMIAERASEGYAPTIAELQQGLGLNSSSLMQRTLHRLKAKGLVTWDATRARTLRLTEKAYAD